MLRMTQINNLYDSASRRRKLVIRFSVLCLVAFFVAQVVPTLAEEQDRSAELQTQIAPSDTLTIASDTSTPVLTEPSGTSTTSSSPTPQPSYTPAALTPGQDMVFEIPTSVSVDPRAQVVSIPRLRIAGPAILLACLSSSGAVMDLISKGAPDDQPASNLYLHGDLSSAVTISGPTEFVTSALNAAGGMRVSGLGRKLAGASVTISLVSIDKIGSSPALCARALPANIRTIRFESIGLGLGLKKGEVKLN